MKETPMLEKTATNRQKIWESQENFEETRKIWGKPSERKLMHYKNVDISFQDSKTFRKAQEPICYRNCTSVQKQVDLEN